MSTQALSLEVFPLHRVLAAGATTRDHVLLRVRARQVEGVDLPRLTVLLVLDVSGSMEGEPLQQVIRSGCRLAEILNDTDVLGVVSFAEAARTVLEPAALTPEARRAARRALESLRANGGTNMSGGLAHAALLTPERAEGERQTLIVMSDGQPNVGAQTPEALGAETRRIKQRGMSVSSLGFGSAHNPQVLQAVSEAGGGRYAFVGDPTMAASAFAQAIGTERDVVADAVSLTLSPGRGVEIVRVLGDTSVSFGAEGLKLALPDLVAGDALNVVVEVTYTAPKAVGPWWPLEACIRARSTATGVEVVTREGVELAVAETAGAGVDATAQEAMLVALVDEARAKARAHGAQRRFAEAKGVIRDMMALLEGSEGFARAKDGPVSDAYEALVDDLAVMVNAPDAETYAKYQRASMDVMDLAQSGTKRKGNSVMSNQSPSSLRMTDGVEGIAPKAQLEVIEGTGLGAVFVVQGTVDIGRTADVAIRIADSSVSRRHARLLFQGGAYWAVDLGSSFGMLVNGQRVDRMPLKNGDVVSIGTTKLRFKS